jgi:hypothetical protein
LRSVFTPAVELVVIETFFGFYGDGVPGDDVKKARFLFGVVIEGFAAE